MTPEKVWEHLEGWRSLTVVLNDSTRTDGTDHDAWCRSVGMADGDKDWERGDKRGNIEGDFESEDVVLLIKAERKVVGGRWSDQKHGDVLQPQTDGKRRWENKRVVMFWFEDTWRRQDAIYVETMTGRFTSEIQVWSGDNYDSDVAKQKE